MMTTAYRVPPSLRQWGRRRTCRAACHVLLTALDLGACLRHVDKCRSCRTEIAQRLGLGWRLARALRRRHGRRAIEAASIE